MNGKIWGMLQGQKHSFVFWLAHMDVSFTSGKVSPGYIVLKLISIKMSI